MRILDNTGAEIKNPDLNVGYLIPDKIISVHHDGVSAKRGKFHYEVIKEYKNGGKDLKRVIDVPDSPAVPAWDEYEEIQRYVEFTADELEAIRNNNIKAKEIEDHNRRLEEDVNTSKYLIDQIREKIGMTDIY